MMPSTTYSQSNLRGNMTSAGSAPGPMTSSTSRGRASLAAAGTEWVGSGMVIEVGMEFISGRWVTLHDLTISPVTGDWHPDLLRVREWTPRLSRSGMGWRSDESFLSFIET